MKVRNKLSVKRFFCILWGTILLCFISSPPVQAFAQSEVIYQVDENYPPFTYTNKNYIYGFDPDLIKFIFGSANDTVDYSYDSWNHVYPRLLSGEIDIAGIIAVTEERKKEILFSDTIFVSSISVYAREDFREISLQDLKTLSVGVGRGYYSESILKTELGNNGYTAYENLSDAITDLSNGKIDVIFENQHLIDNLLVSMRMKGTIVARIQNIYPRDHAYAISKDRPELVPYINERLKQLRKSGIFEELYTKYFYLHSDDYYRELRFKVVLAVSAVVFTVAFILLFLRASIVLLKRKLAVNYTKLVHANDELTVTHEELQAQFEEIQAQYEEIESSRSALEQSEERYRLVAEGANDGLWDWDMITDTVYLSQEWANLMGYEFPCIHGFLKNWTRKVVKEDQHEIRTYYQSCKEEKNQKFAVECRLITKQDSIIWVLVRAKVLRDKTGQMIRMAGSISDITKSKEHEEKINRLAYYDFLTGIPNRVSLHEKLEQILRDSDKTPTVLYYLDIDNFKHINDTLGHDYGDNLLKQVAETLGSIETEQYCVYRVGGDEFAVLLENISLRDEAAAWAERIHSMLCQSWTILDCEIYVSVSIGVTMMPMDGWDQKKILKNADTAMYSAKAAGKNGFQMFREEMLLKVTRRMALEADLRRALTRDEFRLFYQPCIRLSDGELLGVEALIRWTHPAKGMIAPSEFIPIAEETGLIKKVGHWVLEEACRQSRRWKEQGLPEIPIAINVSGIQLEDDDFVHDMKAMLKEYEIAPTGLQIEITESCVIKSMEEGIPRLNEMKKMGIHVLLDDFGTGYSSLHYLLNLPVNVVKIDKSFIDSIVMKPKSNLIINDIISIAHKSSMYVIAEGVETKEQFEYLKEENCDAMQGYYKCKPLPVKEFDEWLHQYRKSELI